MNKFILKTFSFIIFTSVFYTISLVLFQHFAPSMFRPNMNYKLGSYGHLYSRISDIENYRNVDILFLGSSHTYRGFDTRIFSEMGYNTFNLGSSAQTPIQTKVLLNRYLDDLNPALIIYEVFPGTFISDGVESSLDIIANDENDLHSLDMVFKIGNIKTFNTFMYASARDIFNLNKSFEEAVKKGSDTYTSGGYVEKELRFNKPSKMESKEISLNENQLESFSDIVHMIKENDIELILVYAPITKVKYESFRNNKYFDSIMNQYADYYNFNEMMSLNDSLHFYDAHHLNQNGVELFNEKLIEVIEDR